jgi:hypothetical protein
MFSSTTFDDHVDEFKLDMTNLFSVYATKPEIKLRTFDRPVITQLCAICESLLRIESIHNQ